MNVPVTHPDLEARELPAGINPDAVAARKKTAMAGGTPAVTAEANAIMAEQIQAERDAAGEAAGVIEGQYRVSKAAHYGLPNPGIPSTAGDSTQTPQ